MLREGEHGRAPPAPKGAGTRVREPSSTGNSGVRPSPCCGVPRDANAVLRLAILREKIERDGYSAGVLNGATSIEDRLYLSPRSRASSPNPCRARVMGGSWEPTHPPGPTT